MNKQINVHVCIERISRRNRYMLQMLQNMFSSTRTVIVEANLGCLSFTEGLHEPSPDPKRPTGALAEMHCILWLKSK